jgi:hypothetical protein
MLAVCAVVIAASPRAASADWLFAPFVGLTFKGDTTLADLGTVDFEPASSKVHWNFGGTVTWLGDGPLGAEGLFIYTPGFFEAGDSPSPISSSRTMALMGNLVLTAPRGWNEYGLRPLVSGGFGLLHASGKDLDEVELFAKPVNLWGYNIGGGAVGFLSERVGLRFDLRYFSEVRPKDDPEIVGIFSFGPVELSYWTTSVGVVIKY